MITYKYVYLQLDIMYLFSYIINKNMKLFFESYLHVLNQYCNLGFFAE